MTTEYVMPTYNRQPLNFVKGEGCWLFDKDNNAWLDALAGVGVNCLGHKHPAITAVLKQQAEGVIHLSNIYQIPAQEELAERLCREAGMQEVFFGNSGAEANEAAIKLARLYGHKKGVESPVVVVMEGAFHGRTLATLSATANRKVQAGFEPLVSGFVRVPYNDADAVAKVAANNQSIVAVLVEPIQGEGGVNAPDKGYLKALRDVCDAHDLLLMLDEVQTGNGRTGTYFAYQQEDIVPDVVSTAKGLGGGVPIGACLAQGRAQGLMGAGNHGSTYGGNPLCSAVSLAVVKTLQEVMPAVNQRAQQLNQLLHEKLAILPAVKTIRQRGLMVGIELDRDCGELVNIARENHLLINVTAGKVIRLLPPLIITEEEINQLVDKLLASLTLFLDAGNAP